MQVPQRINNMMTNNDDERGYREYAPRALHPKAIVTEGVLCEECKELMQSFFKSRRK